MFREAPALALRMQAFLDTACRSEISRIRLCSANGNDAPKLRNPTAVAFDNERCRIRLQERCEHVVASHKEALVSAAYVDRNATAGAKLMPTTPACTSQRATLLLGPLYGKEAELQGPGVARWLPMNAGLKDSWRYVHGFYHNAARHLSLEEPPEGWDPDGPREQALAHGRRRAAASLTTGVRAPLSPAARQPRQIKVRERRLDQSTERYGRLPADVM